MIKPFNNHGILGIALKHLEEFHNIFVFPLVQPFTRSILQRRVQKYPAISENNSLQIKLASYRKLLQANVVDIPRKSPPDYPRSDLMAAPELNPSKPLTFPSSFLHLIKVPLDINLESGMLSPERANRTVTLTRGDKEI